MALDPNIALGVRPMEVPNALAQYGQIAQLQNYQNQNALAQYQLSSAQRADATENALSAAYKNAYDPTNGNIDVTKLRASLASGGFGSKLPAVEESLLKLDKTRTEADKAKTDLVDAKLKQSRSYLDTINPNDPNAPAQYIAWHEANHHDPVLGPALAARGVTAEQSRARIMDAINKGPAAFAQLLDQSKLGAEKFMELNKPHWVDAGGQQTAVSGLTGQPLSGVAPIKKTATEADTLARERLDWEKANPGYELKEDADGNMFGVNKRTLQSVPVMVGGTAAPAAAPAAGPGMPGARAPAPAAGQPVAPAAGAPKQFQGKGQALTESQGNATAFGMRMLESNKLLTSLEKAGTTSGGRVKGTVEGALTSLVPYQGEKLAAGAGSVMNTLPGFLGGPNENQQSYSAAKENFITAVLRKESGASINPDEFTREERKYFPLAGDSDSVIAQKQKARELAIRAMKIQAGPGAKHIATEADPLGLGL